MYVPKVVVYVTLTPLTGITLEFYVDGPKVLRPGATCVGWRGNAPVGGTGGLCPPAENGFNRIETPSEAYPETYFADSSLGLDLYFN